MLLLDRGYPCFWLLFLLKAKGVEFCVRLKDNWWLKVMDFPDMQDSTITCRLIKIELPSGEKEILCISLIDSKYHYRWNEEEAYKLLKSRIELENLSGKTAQAVNRTFTLKCF